MKNLLASSLATIIALAAIQCCIAADTCGGEIKGQQGEIIIPANSKRCDFTTPPDTKELFLNTDGLILTAGDKITITSKDNNYDYAPPTDAGYIHIGGAFVHPSLSFIFQNGSKTDMSIKYSLLPSLLVNVDINHNFKIINVGAAPNIELKFTKTLNETIHIELSPPELTTECILGNCLMDSTQNELTIFANAKELAELIKVRTDIVDKECSSTYTELKEAQEISGPKTVTKPYQCVNLFKSNEASQESHFDVSFVNFLSVAANNDELLVRDVSRRILIDRTSEADYKGRVISTTGPQLAIIYRSAGVPTNNGDLGLKLTIIPQKYGGIVREKKEIVFQALIPTTYTFIPNESKCMNLIPSTLGDASLNVTTNGIKSEFGPNSILSPILGSNREMIVSYYGKVGLKIQFIPDGPCCHQMNQQIFQMSGSQGGSCYWTIAAGGSITFDEINLSPDGCVTVQPLNNAKAPLYSRCNIGPNEVIPRMIVSQAYVNVTLPSKMTKLTALVASSPVASVTIFEDSIMTSGYPVSYPVTTSQEAYVLNATKSKYLIHVDDIDLRSGEKLQIRDLEINNRSVDVLVTDATSTKITLTRPAAPSDFSLRRGFNISRIAFQDIQVLSGNLTSKNNSITLENVTNSLIKISPNQSQYRVNYNISSPEKVDLHLYDGMSISGPVSTSQVGSTTSSSLLIIAKSTNNSTITIQYWYTACEKDALPCDNGSRCVPRDFQCKGKYYCSDGSDMKQVCNSTGPPPPPSPPSGQTGVGGFTVFILCILMLTLGVLLSTYGPGLYKTLEDRFRGNGQYNSFTSVE